MPARSVLTYPDSILREQAKAVSKIDPNIKRLIHDMVETMRAANGVGLAANQVGVLQKVLVYDDGTGLRVLINPKVVRAAGEQVAVEGCLSVPGLQGEVRRANEIEVRGKDEFGRTVKVKAEGLAARIIQHELDHLNGTLFLDRAEPSSLQYVTADEAGDAVEA